MMTPDDSGGVKVGEALQRAVTTYCADWCHPKLPTFRLHRHTFTSWHGTHEASIAGCYAVYAIDGTLLYIGKASFRTTIGNRLFHHFKVSKKVWADHAAHIFFIEPHAPFQASSLEEYLIEVLLPAYNIVGVYRSKRKTMTGET